MAYTRVRGKRNETNEQRVFDKVLTFLTLFQTLNEYIQFQHSIPHRISLLIPDIPAVAGVQLL